METSIREDMNVEFRPVPRKGRLEAERGREGDERLDIGLLEGQACETATEHLRPGGDVPENSLGLPARKSVRLGHEDGHLRRLQHVDVKSYVRAAGAGERRLDPFFPQVDPARSDEIVLGRIEIAGA